MSRTLATVMLAGGLLAAGQAVAEDHDMTPTHETDSGPMLWHNESLTYLYGKNFKINPPIQQTFTLEHASGWTWGDLFIFFDQINYNGKEDASNGKNTYYGEITPRLSFGKLTGADLSFGPVKDVLLAGTYEFGEGDTEAYLLGPGFDLAIPGFDYFQLNFYYRKPDGNRVRAGAWQITPVVVLHHSGGQLRHPHRRLHGLGDQQQERQHQPPQPERLSRQPALQPTGQVRPGQGPRLRA